METVQSNGIFGGAPQGIPCEIHLMSSQVAITLISFSANKISLLCVCVLGFRTKRTHGKNHFNA